MVRSTTNIVVFRAGFEAIALPLTESLLYRREGRRKMARKSRSMSRKSRSDMGYVQPKPPQDDDRSIGSALSLKDQFDIIIPVKKLRDCDDSDVSSITTDEHKKMLRYLYTAQRQRASNLAVGWCCCSEMTSLPAQRSRSPGKISTKKKRRPKSVKGGSQVPSESKTCDVSRSQFSLFDALSDDDEEDFDEEIIDVVMTDREDQGDFPIKRKRSWRVSIRKKMPWTRKPSSHYIV